jgi:CBS domain-containing protein/anti-sigma regulatory factor (Ser/Thr protein kinase)
VATDKRISKVQELVYEIRVGDVMRDDVITVGPNSMMSELGKILREKRISGTPVVDRRKLMGIISIDDFIRWLSEREDDCPVARKMTKDVQTLYPDEPLVHAVNRFEKFGYGRFPVVDRDSLRLRGIITRGAIVAGLLKKLDIDHFEEEQVNRQRMRHLVGDIFADKIAFFFQYNVAGHDFNRAGESASRLKRTLKRLGVDPQVVRRVAIATYEAEMNLIIYTDGGRIRVRVEPDEILVRVEDSGPGIPDIEKALRPGYSTAPEWVRELGFGAGMGLDNIRKCASRMGLRSRVGKGTQLRIYVSTEDGAASEAN